MCRHFICLLLLFLASPALALAPAAETGACSLESAAPATIAAIDENFELLLDDGRRAALSGVEFPGGDAELSAKAAKRLNDWLSGRQVFLAPWASRPDRWGRLPAAVFASADNAPDSPLVSLGAALLAEGLARFRPDALASPCAESYLQAEGQARAKKAGLWARPGFDEIDLSHPDVDRNRELFLGKKGMCLVSGVVRSVGETQRTIYLNFGDRRGDFAAMISRRNLDIFERARISPRALVGRRARVRGLIETTSGPRIDLVSPHAIEILDGADTP